MSDWFENQLKSALSSISFDQDDAEASITSVEGFSGDVNICKRRNKTSWIYDVNFKVKVLVLSIQLLCVFTRLYSLLLECAVVSVYH